MFYTESSEVDITVCVMDNTATTTPERTMEEPDTAETPQVQEMQEQPDTAEMAEDQEMQEQPDTAEMAEDQEMQEQPQVRKLLLIYLILKLLNNSKYSHHVLA